MSELPAEADVVVIGAGIVGNSMAYQLALHGWKNIVLLDKGALPNPGGSTGHASNFIFLVDHSKEMTDLTLDSVRQYQELNVFTQSGGIEIARAPERMEELKRRLASSHVLISAVLCCAVLRYLRRCREQLQLQPLRKLLFQGR